jgi:hypothetical protein
VTDDRSGIRADIRTLYTHTSCLRPQRSGHSLSSHCPHNRASTCSANVPRSAPLSTGVHAVADHAMSNRFRLHANCTLSQPGLSAQPLLEVSSGSDADGMDADG